MHLVYVHGRRQQHLTAAALHQIWDDALSQGLGNAGETHWPPGISSSIAYYADILAAAAGPSPFAKLDAARRALLMNLAAAWVGRVGGLSPIAQIAGSLLANLVPTSWTGVRSWLQAAEQGPAGDSVLAALTYDVALYLQDAQVAQDVDAVVAKAIDGAIAQGPGPVVVIGHSLGSVVAYNVLRRRPASPKVWFATLGSPLATQTVASKLHPQPLVAPDCVVQWLNAFDPDDVVALNPVDSHHWPYVKRVHNLDDVRNPGLNQHDIAGYLEDPRVASWIVESP